MTKLRRVAARGIIFRDGKLLAATFIRPSDGAESPWWGTFGGGVDPEESLHDAIYREMIEETGIAPKIGKLLFIQQFADDEKEHMEFFFHIENADDYTTIHLEETSHGALELGKAQFVDPKTTFMKPVFLETINIQDYIDNEKPVYFHSELGMPRENPTL